jgi:hypothetical protein
MCVCVFIYMCVCVCVIFIGMLTSTLNLIDDLARHDELIRFLEDHPRINIEVVGHSLGAGVSILCGLLLKYWKQGPLYHAFRFHRNQVRVWAYAAPPVLSYELAHHPTLIDLITVITYNKDIISRLSLENFFKLKQQVGIL